AAPRAPGRRRGLLQQPRVRPRAPAWQRPPTARTGAFLRAARVPQPAGAAETVACDRRLRGRAPHRADVRLRLAARHRSAGAARTAVLPAPLAPGAAGAAPAGAGR